MKSRTFQWKSMEFHEKSGKFARKFTENDNSRNFWWFFVKIRIFAIKFAKIVGNFDKVQNISLKS